LRPPAESHSPGHRADATKPDVRAPIAEGRAQAQRKAWRFLDLQPHANQKLKLSFEGKWPNDLAELPLGEQTLAGTKFNIGESLIQLGGGTQHPAKVEGIQVAATVSTLHFLHATQHHAVPNDSPVGYYTVNFEDQSQSTIPIVYGKDISDWWYHERAGCGRAQVAWEGANEEVSKHGAKLRLYHTRWQNPQPSRVVTSIDFAATTVLVAPFCVAMTVEE
jgi:hypothetical protein